MKPLKVIAIAAMDEARVIGYQGKLPWSLPQDLKRFSDLTVGHTVIMGRKTYDSLPKKFQPLPDRLNVIVTRNPTSIFTRPGMMVVSSAERYIEEARAGKAKSQGKILWVIGGGEIYRLTQKLWQGVELTKVAGVHDGDATFPEFEDDFKLEKTVPSQGCDFLTYVRSAG